MQKKSHGTLSHNTRKSPWSHNLLNSSSTNPFPKAPDLFYNESKVLWEKQVLRLKEEKKMLNKNSIHSSYKNENSQKENPEIKSSKGIILKTNPNRNRDFISDCFKTDENQSNKTLIFFEQQGDLKHLTPMHFKWYEGTLQSDRHIKKKTPPETHPTYDKRDDHYNPIVSNVSKDRKIRF